MSYMRNTVLSLNVAELDLYCMLMSPLAGNSRYHVSLSLVTFAEAMYQIWVATTS